MAELDTQMALYFGDLYFDGAHSSAGARTLSTDCHICPVWGRQHGLFFRKVRQALREW